MAKRKVNRKDKIKPKPRVHQDLSGLEVSIDPFGEIRSSMEIEKINRFLDENVDDKKLHDRADFDAEVNAKIKKKPGPKGSKKKPTGNSNS